MQVVRLVKTSDLQQVSELIKKTGIGMTTMPKNRKEVQERIAWSVKSANKKSANPNNCLLYTSPSPRDGLLSRMPSSA